jgi:hypothetical protein
VDFHFAFARGTLDIFHALEHVGAAAKAQFGEGTAETAQWRNRARDALVADGWSGIERVIHEARANAVRAPHRAALTKLEEYLRPHAAHLNYAERLAAGRPIGSGLIEGACKNYLGRRLKQTGGALENPQRQPHGRPGRPGLRRPMDRLLGKSPPNP